MKMTLELAKDIQSAAQKKAQEMGVFCSIVVVDEGAWLVALHRMNGAPAPTANIAWDKAWTAASFGMPSAEIAKFGDSSKSNCGFNTQNWNDRLTPIPGGLPIKDGDKIIGGIGISGAALEQDVILAQDAIQAF